MERKKRKKKVFLIVLLAVFGLFSACFTAGYIYDQQFMPYNRASYLSDRGYARALGVAALDYEAIQKKYGEPENQSYWVPESNSDVSIRDCVYPRFKVRYVVSKSIDGENKYYLALLTITDEDIRFGRMDIGIGSTREDVQKAYAEDPKIDEADLEYSSRDYPGVDEGFSGEDWCRILFCYDENGKVESMAYEPSAFW